MGRPIILFLCVFLISIMILPSAVFSSLGSDIELEALEIEYDLERELFWARGNVQFSYGDLILFSDEFLLDLEQERFQAKGNISLKRDGRLIEGQDLTYNFVEGIGQLNNPRTQFDELRLWGDDIQFSEEKSEISSVNLTPCSLPDPHYRARAQRVVINPEGKIEAFNVTVLWGETPFFYLPYYIARYEDGTITSPFPRPTVGFDSERGPFLGLTFTHSISDNIEGEYFLETTGRAHRFFADLSFAHQITDDLLGEYKLEFSDVELLELLDFSFQHNLSPRLKGEIGFTKEKNEPWEYGFRYGYGATQWLEIQGGFAHRGGEFFLSPGYEVDLDKGNHSLLVDWNLSKGEIHRLRSDLGLGELTLRGDWQPYRDRFLGDLSYGAREWDWLLRYRRGTDVERLPQVRFSFQTHPGGEGFLDGGYFSEEGVETLRFGAKYTTKFSLGPFSTELGFEGYNYSDFDSQGSFLGRLNWTKSWGNQKLRLGILGTEVFGETPFDFDIIEKKQQVFGEWTAKFNGDNNFPVYNTGLEISFDLITRELSKLTGSLKKEEDCYYWEIEIDPIQREFEFSVGIPF